MVAAFMGSLEAVRALIPHSDVNAVSPDDGQSALHCVASARPDSLSAVLELLLEAGADRDLRDALGRRAVDLLLSQTRPGELDKPEYCTDEFRMYSFKVADCPNEEPHDWTECPFAHPGEKARRRDPRVFAYTGAACPDFRKGVCKRGDACTYGHGVFECWLHPSRYRTQLCKDGEACDRRVCFFAHKECELREAPPAEPGAPGTPCASASRAASEGGGGDVCGASDASGSAAGTPKSARVSRCSSCSACSDDAKQARAGDAAGDTAEPEPAAASPAAPAPSDGRAAPAPARAKAAAGRRSRPQSEASCASSACATPTVAAATAAAAAAASAPRLPVPQLASPAVRRRPSADLPPAQLAALARASPPPGPDCGVSSSDPPLLLGPPLGCAMDRPLLTGLSLSSRAPWPRFGAAAPEPVASAPLGDACAGGYGYAPAFGGAAHAQGHAAGAAAAAAQIASLHLAEAAAAAKRDAAAAAAAAWVSAQQDLAAARAAAAVAWQHAPARGPHAQAQQALPHAQQVQQVQQSGGQGLDPYVMAQLQQLQLQQLHRQQLQQQLQQQAHEHQQRQLQLLAAAGLYQ